MNLSITRRKFVKVVSGSSVGMILPAMNSSIIPKAIGRDIAQEKPYYLGEHWDNSREKKLNIILIIIDTLRFDAIGAISKKWIQTPNFDRFAERSWIFSHAFTNSYPTIPMRTDTITGQYGFPFNPWLPLRMNTTTLPQVMAKAGYCTQLIHDTPHLVNGGHSFDWPFHAWTFIRGAEVDRPWIDDKPFSYLENWAQDPLFDFLGDPELKECINNFTCKTYTRANRNRRIPKDWNSAQLFNTASRFLRDNSRRDNFFLWIDSFDPHEPWDAPPEYVRLYDKTPGYDGKVDPRVFWAVDRKKEYHDKPMVQKRIKAYYAAKVTHLDRWFGDFLDTFEETELDQNTAIILTADHGTCVGENGRFGKRLYGMGEFEGHVPMMVYVPGKGTGHDDRFIQPQDLFSTILGIAGISKPPEVDGLNIFASDHLRREVAVGGNNKDYRYWEGRSNELIFTVFSKEWILKFAPRKEACELYSYGSEKENLASSNPGVVEELREAAMDELSRQGLHEKIIEWLRSEGEKSFPEGFHSLREKPENWKPYWQRNYMKW